MSPNRKWTPELPVACCTQNVRIFSVFVAAKYASAEAMSPNRKWTPELPVACCTQNVRIFSVFVAAKYASAEAMSPNRKWTPELIDVSYFTCSVVETETQILYSQS
ncbi:unnamed protein product [Arctia plantaginis]|uniref:Uncharacterized protein n=1 Tax=Arctia plantaginis TaxID=874455 RepID=A0A8S1A9V9_ARCPL|nr:unnamed protein product [Arctia plantaginis]